VSDQQTDRRVRRVMRPMTPRALFNANAVQTTSLALTEANGLFVAVNKLQLFWLSISYDCSLSLWTNRPTQRRL